jgi:hypothetical protein
MIRQLRKDLESREQFGDTGTADFLTAVMEKHEKMAWMLRSFYRITKSLIYFIATFTNIHVLY